MIAFVKRSKLKVSYILVYSVDRFSRTGANGLFIASQLKENGILIQAVTQPADTNTPSGALQQNMQFIFSEYDNQLRSQKTKAGMVAKLMQGDWVAKSPLGYDSIKINGKKETSGHLSFPLEWTDSL